MTLLLWSAVTGPSQWWRGGWAEPAGCCHGGFLDVVTRGEFGPDVRGWGARVAIGRRGGLAVVLESARDRDDPRPLVLTEHRWAGRISSADYSGTTPVGSMTLPKRVEHRQPRVRRDLA